MQQYHNHHIIPKHMGGTDSPENLQKVTVEEHAELHKKLWENFGKTEDFIAFRALSGQISMERASIEAWEMGSKRGGISNVTNKTGFFKRSKEQIRIDSIKSGASLNNSFRNSVIQKELNKRAQIALNNKRQNDSEWFAEIKAKMSKSKIGQIPANKTEIYCIKCRKLSQYSRLLRSHKNCFK